MHSDWFFLGWDFAIRTIPMEMVISSIFFLFSKAGKFKLCNQNYEKKEHVNALIFAKKLFYRAYNKNEEDKYLRSEFYYPEDLETSNAKTESGIGESREAIDDFIKKKKVQTQIRRWLAADLNTLLH